MHATIRVVSVSLWVWMYYVLLIVSEHLKHTSSEGMLQSLHKHPVDPLPLNTETDTWSIPPTVRRVTLTSLSGVGSPSVKQLCCSSRLFITHYNTIQTREQILDIYTIKMSKKNATPNTVGKNVSSPQYSRLVKEMASFSDLAIPFEYTSEGTPRRHKILANYHNLINQTCEAADADKKSAQTETAPHSKSTISDSLMRFIRTIITCVMQQELYDDDNIFQHGCDSLQATSIHINILHALRQTSSVDTHAIPLGFVYSHPTISSLAKYIAHISASGLSKSEQVQRAAKVRELEDMLAEFTSSFPAHSPLHTSMPAKETILLTGSTGGIGAHVLEELLALPTVERVYTLNRPPLSTCSLRERHAATFKSRGIDVSILDSEKLVLLEADAGAPKFGLGNDIYETMKASVTTIMHIAWKVNFNRELSSFRPNIKALRNLIDFALSSPLPSPPRIEFTSSINVLSSWPTDTPAPEAPIMDASLSLGGGYGESKWVAERILHVASEKTALRPVVVRVGQLSGGRHGAWNTKEWFPSLVKSATIMKCLPDCKNIISWVPMDVAARVFVEMRSSSSVFLNLAHPRATTWSSIVRPIAARLRVPLVSYAEWLGRLEQDLLTGNPSNPALRLMRTYRGAEGYKNDPTREAMNLATLQTTLACQASSILGDTSLATLGSDDVDAWLAYWKAEGFVVEPSYSRYDMQIQARL